MQRLALAAAVATLVGLGTIASAAPASAATTVVITQQRAHSHHRFVNFCDRHPWAYACRPHHRHHRRPVVIITQPHHYHSHYSSHYSSHVQY